MSGMDAAPWDEPARAAGVRIVAPARPDLDGSSPAPGRDTAAWADDVRALLDGLEIPQASVLGWSMGGQYALACAARLPERVPRAVVVAGALPFTDPGMLPDLNRLDTRFTNQSEHRPWAARLTFRVMAQTARRAPKLWTKSLTKGVPDAEATTVRRLSDPGLAAAAAVALACTHGMVEEYLAWARPWGFDAADIRVPTTIWQGAADELVPRHWAEALVPRHWAEALADHIPGARLSMHDGEGHFVAFSHQAEVLADLV
jgi:pimeloyl-ACP methyl ester carboxylesterase